MNTILIANAIALIASILMVYTGYIKKKDFKAFGYYRIILGCNFLVAILS